MKPKQPTPAALRIAMLDVLGVPISIETWRAVLKRAVEIEAGDKEKETA